MGHGYINATGVFPQAEDVIDETGKLIYDILKNIPARRCESKRKIYKQRSDSMERYSVVFSSSTGNTKLLADAIDEALPKENRDYFGEITPEVPESEMLYVGFWTDRGNADKTALEFLQRLKNKKVFLFGTAGFGGSEDYFKKILANAESALDGSNTVAGEFMCQGKMPQAVRERYMSMKAQPNPPANLDMLIENFDRALSHPDAEDLERLKKTVLK